MMRDGHDGAIRLLTSAAVAAMLALGAGASAAKDVPAFEPSARCPATPADSAGFITACAFLLETPPLRARRGARVYRENWASPYMDWFGRGTITLTVAANGRATLATPWRASPLVLKPGELADFEPLLAASDFAQRPVFNQALAACTGGTATTLEAVVGGHYRLVYFDYCGGVSSGSIADALDRLWAFAAARSGRRYPFDREHATFRGQ